MINHHINHGGSGSNNLLLIIIVLFVVYLYIYAARHSNLQYRQWPVYRYGFFILGVLCVTFAITGPLAEWAHYDFRAHMTGHLLLGMLGPLLIALSLPMTLALRSLNVLWARRITRILKMRTIRWFTHPVITTTLNIGGLWLLYTTDLFTAMHSDFLLHVIVHFHIFFAGYLFTISMIYTEPIPHRHSFMYRAVVMVLAFAGHGMLSKYIYAHPPDGVSSVQGKIGGLLMYYGGDAIDFVLIFVFCLQWFHTARPRSTLPMNYN